MAMPVHLELSFVRVPAAPINALFDALDLHCVASRRVSGLSAER
jgi:hypothetical protein